MWLDAIRKAWHDERGGVEIGPGCAGSGSVSRNRSTWPHRGSLWGGEIPPQARTTNARPQNVVLVQAM